MDLIYINNVAINKKMIVGQSYSCEKVQEVEQWYDANGGEHNDLIRERYVLSFDVPSGRTKAEIDELMAWIDSGTTDAQTEFSAAFCPETGNYVTFVAKKSRIQIPIAKAEAATPTYSGFKLQFVGV
jgi:hypothetical protein